MLSFLRSIASKVANGSSLRARLARATVWMLAGSGLNQALAMLASIGTARILGKVAFGAFGAVRSTVMTMAVLAGGGLGLATTRYVAALRIQDPERAGRLISLVLTLAWTMTGIAAAACALLARPVAVHIMKSENLALPLMVSALAIVFSTVSGVQIGVVAGCEAFRPMAVLLTLEGLSAGALMVAGAWLNGVTGAVAGYVAGTFISFLLRHRQVKIECRNANIPLMPMSISHARAEVPFLVTAVIPSMLLVVGAQPAEWLVRMMLVRGPEGMAALGLFTAAYSWAQLVQFIPSQIASPALTLLSNLVGAGDWPAFRRLLVESAGVVFGAAAVIAIPLALLSRFVMGLYGPAFRDGAAVFSVVVLAYAFGSVSTMLRSTFLAAGREWLQLAFTLGWGIGLPLFFLVQGKRTAMTLALSYGISFLMVVVAQLLVAWFLFRGSRTTRTVHEGA
ncbi:MAG TPA: oligosaccharide flippase family protein [Thermoanaerobaculia bacterium]|nr:oligosaccharide flippase family protein [Thermoanaerobaculia bacterium]